MPSENKGPIGLIIVVIVVTAAATIGVMALLFNIFERKQEARTTFVQLAEVHESSTDPAPWGLNFPLQYEGYKKSADSERTSYGGSNALPPSKLDEDPWLKRLFAGYAFSIDYREARGHAFMLHDQEVTKRVTEVQQAGACLHCHASVIPMYRRVGLETLGQPVNDATMNDEYNEEAVQAGFAALSRMKYEEVHAELMKTGDGVVAEGKAHPVSCIDCHAPDDMQLRITRPGFIEGIAKLASSDAPVPFLPSVEEWRESGSKEPYDANKLASRQEMRSFVCAQCHVEYYCANKMTLTFPWKHGLRMEDLEREWDETKFEDGTAFFDYIHKETGTPVFKAQHPEFELWSQGIHARAGVSCSDCHMPYERHGATKVSSHWVRSPMLDPERSCQTCHNVPGDELVARVDAIQDRTRGLIDRAAEAMTDMLDAIVAAQEAGATDEQLVEIRKLQRKAMWRLDYICSENSKGFHADQEAARILAESIDYSRQAQTAAALLGGS